jgi:hypothetical protein
MSIELLTLLHRDHHDVMAGLDELQQPELSAAELRGILDGVRLGILAHAEAEDIVLHGAVVQSAVGDILAALVSGVHEAHALQEAALSALVCAKPNTTFWRERARKLRDLVHEHATIEEQQIVPAIRALAPEVYGGLAGRFATERLVQLSFLQPSVQFFAPEARAS